MEAILSSLSSGDDGGGASGGKKVTFKWWRITFGVVYTLFFAVLAYYFIKRQLGLRKLSLDLSMIFFILTPIFLVLRITWWFATCYSGSNDILSLLLNRTSVLFYLVMFQNVVFVCAETASHTVNVQFAEQTLKGDLSINDYMGKGMKLGFWGSISAMIVWTLGTVFFMLIYYKGRPDDNNGLYMANVISLAVFFFIQGLAYFYYNFRLFRRLLNKSSLGMWDVYKTLIFSTIILVCMMLRVVMLSWRIVTGHYIPWQWVYECFAYPVPELFPLLLFLINFKDFAKPELIKDLAPTQDTLALEDCRPNEAGGLETGLLAPPRMEFDQL